MGWGPLNSAHSSQGLGCDCGDFCATSAVPCGLESGCCRRILQNSPQCLFFHFFFLRNSSCSSCCSIQGGTCPLTQPTSPTTPGSVRVRARQGPVLNSPPPSHIVSVGAHRPCVFATLSLFPSLRLKATRSLLVLLKPCLAGE